MTGHNLKSEMGSLSRSRVSSLLFLTHKFNEIETLTLNNSFILSWVIEIPLNMITFYLNKDSDTSCNQISLLRVTNP